MKKTIKTISLLLAVSLCLSLFGCDYINEWMGKNGEQNVGESDDIVGGNHSYHELFPDGYTGGFRHQPGANIEYWWVETYEEAIEAIELLKSHGSTFSDEMILTYEGDEFDTKYCFTITGVGAKTEKIKWGDNPFNRYAENVKISCFAFFEDVTIDEINHSYVSKYNAYKFGTEYIYLEWQSNSTIDDITIGEWTSETGRYYIRAYYCDEIILHIEPTFSKNNKEILILDDHIKNIISLGDVVKINEV